MPTTTKLPIAIWHRKTEPATTFGFPTTTERGDPVFPEINLDDFDFLGVLPAGQPAEVVAYEEKDRAKVKLAGRTMYTAKWALKG